MASNYLQIQILATLLLLAEINTRENMSRNTVFP